MQTQKKKGRRPTFHARLSKSHHNFLMLVLTSPLPSEIFFHASDLRLSVGFLVSYFFLSLNWSQFCPCSLSARCRAGGRQRGSIIEHVLKTFSVNCNTAHYWCRDHIWKFSSINSTNIFNVCIFDCFVSSGPDHKKLRWGTGREIYNWHLLWWVLWWNLNKQLCLPWKEKSFFYEQWESKPSKPTPITFIWLDYSAIFTNVTLLFQETLAQEDKFWK